MLFFFSELINCIGSKVMVFNLFYWNFIIRAYIDYTDSAS
jgi:hypothetical protein